MEITMTNRTLPGASLDSILEQSSLPAADALRYAPNLALALRSGHESGTVYRVLDPSRIYLSAHEAVIETASECNSCMAPEILGGGSPDARSDIFAFGALMYRLLTGRQPFASMPGAQAAHGLDEQVAAPLQWVRDGQLDVASGNFPGLERVILQCLAWSPDRRWQSVRPICVELKLLVIAVNRRSPAANKARRSINELVRERVSHWEAPLMTRAAACEQTVRDLQGLILDTGERLSYAVAAMGEQVRSQGQSIEAYRSTAGRTDDVLERLVESIEACNRAVLEMQRAGAAAQERTQQEIRAIQDRLISHDASVECLERNAKRTDDLLERVVETIDSLQSFVVERTADE